MTSSVVRHRLVTSRLAVVFALSLCLKGFSMSAGSSWKSLASLPQAIAGQCAGTVDSKLVVAGGSTWTAPPWAGGKKDWSAQVYSLNTPSGTWNTEAALPRATGYGASAQWNTTLICVGGQNANTVFNTVIRFVSKDGKIVVEELPPLPDPLTNAAAGVVGDTLYVVGGQHDLTPQSISKEIWTLDLHADGKLGRWRSNGVAPWQHARILPVVVGCGDALYVMSGADLRVDTAGSPIRTYLKDSWRRNVAGDWVRLADLPAAVVAAPSTCSNHNTPIIFGGDDGALVSQVQTLKDSHPGFSKDAHQLNPLTGGWHAISHLPLSLVTTAAARWQGHYVIPGGENQPGHRSNQVIAVAIDE
jgi:N-acetylneuraminic acid mutarotase